MRVCKYGLIIIMSISIFLLITTNLISTVYAKSDKFEKWLIQHMFKVCYMAYYNYDKKSEVLYVRVTFRVLEGPKSNLLGLEVTDYEFTVNVTNYGDINEVNKKLAKSLRLNDEELRLLKEIGIFIKSLGNSTEILTTKDDPPNWWEEPPYLPRYTYKKDDNVYKAADPINIVIYYNPDIFDYILNELQDEIPNVNKTDVDDDWPSDLKGDNVKADTLYIYDYTESAWVSQDAHIVEGGDDSSGTGDNFDRIHARLWQIYSPYYGYIIVGNVHLESWIILGHDVIHVDNDYSYGYEYAEDAFSEEFNKSIQGERWWAWHIIYHTWYASSSKPTSEGYDIITSYYVIVEYQWDILKDAIDMGNSRSPDGTKIFGDGKATLISLRSD